MKVPNPQNHLGPWQPGPGALGLREGGAAAAAAAAACGFFVDLGKGRFHGNMPGKSFADPDQAKGHSNHNHNHHNNNNSSGSLF